MKPFSRGAGILLSIASLPSAYGIGTLGRAAYQFVDLLVDLRQRYWHILPLGPTSFGDSPYQSFSVFAGNPYLIDLMELIRRGLLTEQEVHKYDWEDNNSEINYELLFENRYGVLEQAFRRFDRYEESFLAFCDKEDFWLNDYSFFMALKAYSDHVAWTDWDEDIRDADMPGCERYREQLAEQIIFWKFCQYEFFRQWMQLKQYANSRGIRIIGDIPFYAGADSADVWAHRNWFLLNSEGRPKVAAGSPPDVFSPEGQIWGNPLYNWESMEAEGFTWWKQRMEMCAWMYDAVRIDHFAGIVRSFGIDLRRGGIGSGRWYKGPGRKLTDIMEKSAGECRLIAECLGYQIPAAKKLLQKTGWSDIKVLLMAFDRNTANEHLPHNYIGPNHVVYTGTHDSDTIVGYCRDKTEYELAFLYEYLGVKTREEIPDAIIRLAYSSIADVVILQMQDILRLGRETRMNRPGAAGGNWRWRIGNEILNDERRSCIRTWSLIYRR